MRDLAVIDDAVMEAFRAYREREARGKEAGDLVRAIEELVGSSVAVKAAREAALKKEADPEWEAPVSEFPERRRRDKPKAPRSAEAG